MQKLVSLKLLSETIARKNISKTSVSTQQTFFSNFRTSQFTTHYSTLSHLVRPRNGPSANKKLTGFRPNTLCKAQIIGILGGRVHGVLGASIFKRNFHSNFSFNSHRRGQWQSIFRRLTTDGVVIGLVLINAAVFMLWRIADRTFMLKNFTVSVDNFTSGRVHTLITHAFSHIEAGHIISNMIGLYFFGMSIGNTFGPDYLLKLYLCGAVAGSVFCLLYHAFIAPSLQTNQTWALDPKRVPTLGASGAVNAIMLLDIFLFPKKTLYFDFIIPVPAILLGIFLIGKDTLRILEGDSQISGSAHLGGAAVAAIAWMRIRRGRF